MKNTLIALCLISCISQSDWEENTKAKVIFERKMQIKSELSSCSRSEATGSNAIEKCIGITVNNIICQYKCIAAHCTLELQDDSNDKLYNGD